MTITIHRLLPALLLAAACGTATRYLPTGPTPHPLASRDDGSVELFVDRTPDRPYVEVGLLEGHRRNIFSHPETFDIYAAIRHEGADEGCDGVVVTGSHDLWRGHDRLEGYVASCIVYTPAPAPIAATARPSADGGS